MEQVMPVAIEDQQYSVNPRLVDSRGVDVDAIAAEWWRFQPHTYAEYVSRGKWVAYPWLRYVGEVVADTIAQGGGRLIINCPPRVGKSELISHWCPVWFMDNLPAKRVILTSYEDGVAKDWGRMVRNEIERNDLCRIELREDSKSAGRWHTPQGGGMVTAGVGGPITGKGGDLIIVDDPHKNWAEANSPLMQGRIWDWFVSTLYTRCEPGATIIIVMQRWADEDLTGMLVERHPDKWQVISLPALAEENDALGRAVGEPLCPERYGTEAYEDIRSKVGRAVWSALYQQKPQSAGTGKAYGNFNATLDLADNIPIRHDLPLHLSFDFNIDPGMHVELGQHDERDDLFTAFEEIHGFRMSIPQAMDRFAEWLKEQGGVGAFPEYHIFGDASGHSESRQTSQSDYELVAKCLREIGIENFRIRVPRNAPGVKNSINAFNEVLCDVRGKRHYKVNKARCPRLVADLKHVKIGFDGLIVKSNKALSHACLVAGTPVWTRFGNLPIEQIGIGDEVLTRKGWRRVTWCGRTYQRADVMAVTLSNGGVLAGTPEHLVRTVVDWVPLGTLTCGNVLHSLATEEAFGWRQRKSCIVGSHIIDGQANDISRVHSRGVCTGRYGSTTSGRSLPDITFTTRTGIQPTMLRRISNAFLDSGISVSTGAIRSCARESEQFWRRLGLPRLHGIDPPRGVLGIDDIPSKNESPSGRHARFAGGNLMTFRGGSSLSSARRDAGPMTENEGGQMTRRAPVLSAGRVSRLTSTTRHAVAPVSVVSVSAIFPERIPVYDITVEDAHEFYANGVLVHNSDAERYRIAYLRPVGDEQAESVGGRFGV